MTINKGIILIAALKYPKSPTNRDDIIMDANILNNEGSLIDL